eukprot:401659-Prymnesium_polylepis.1
MVPRARFHAARTIAHKRRKKRTSPTRAPRHRRRGGVVVLSTVRPAPTHHPSSCHRTFDPPRAPQPALPALPKSGSSRRSCRSA